MYAVSVQSLSLAAPLASVSRSMPSRMSKVSGALDREDVVCAAAPGDQHRRRRAGDHLAANIGALEEVAASSPSSKFNSAKGAPEA